MAAKKTAAAKPEPEEKVEEPTSAPEDVVVVQGNAFTFEESAEVTAYVPPKEK
jgi:hypothetical protein